MFNNYNRKNKVFKNRSSNGFVFIIKNFNYRFFIYLIIVIESYFLIYKLIFFFLGFDSLQVVWFTELFGEYEDSYIFKDIFQIINIDVNNLNSGIDSILDFKKNSKNLNNGSIANNINTNLFVTNYENIKESTLDTNIKVDDHYISFSYESITFFIAYVQVSLNYIYIKNSFINSHFIKFMYFIREHKFFTKINSFLSYKAFKTYFLIVINYLYYKSKFSNFLFRVFPFTVLFLVFLVFIRFCLNVSKLFLTNSYIYSLKSLNSSFWSNQSILTFNHNFFFAFKKSYDISELYLTNIYNLTHLPSFFWDGLFLNDFVLFDSLLFEWLQLYLLFVFLFITLTGFYFVVNKQVHLKHLNRWFGIVFFFSTFYWYIWKFVYDIVIISKFKDFYLNIFKDNILIIFILFLIMLLFLFNLQIYITYLINQSNLNFYFLNDQGYCFYTQYATRLLDKKHLSWFYTKGFLVADLVGVFMFNFIKDFPYVLYEFFINYRYVCIYKLETVFETLNLMVLNFFINIFDICFLVIVFINSLFEKSLGIYYFNFNLLTYYNTGKELFFFKLINKDNIFFMLNSFLIFMEKCYLNFLFFYDSLFIINLSIGLIFQVVIGLLVLKWQYINYFYCADSDKQSSFLQSYRKGRDSLSSQNSIFTTKDYLKINHLFHNNKFFLLNGLRYGNSSFDTNEVNKHDWNYIRYKWLTMCLIRLSFLGYFLNFSIFFFHFFYIFIEFFFIYFWSNFIYKLN